MIDLRKHCEQLTDLIFLNQLNPISLTTLRNDLIDKCVKYLIKSDSSASMFDDAYRMRNKYRPRKRTGGKSSRWELSCV